MFKNEYVNKVYEDVVRKNPNEKEFLQAVYEVLESLEDVVENNSEIEKQNILSRIVEPERFVSFRVAWVDDEGKVQW